MGWTWDKNAVPVVDDDALHDADAAVADAVVAEEEEEAEEAEEGEEEVNVAVFIPLGISSGKVDDEDDDDDELAAVAATAMTGSCDGTTTAVALAGDINDVTVAEVRMCWAMTSRDGCDKSMCPMACNN